MKKQFFSLSLALVVSASLIFTGCKKDEEGPVITLKGDATVTSILNAAYTDEGATAEDNEDGDVTSSITVDVTAVNKDLAGTYIVTYTCVDKAGNEGTASRTVNVENSAKWMDGTFSCAETIAGSTSTYDQVSAASTTVNGRVTFTKFANYSNNNSIYVTVTGSTITIPSQTGVGIGSLVQSHTFSGSGTKKSATEYTLTYTDVNNSNSSSANVSAVYTKK